MSETDTEDGISSILESILSNTSENNSTNWWTLALQIITVLTLFLKPVIMSLIKNRYNLKLKKLEIEDKRAEQLQQTTNNPQTMTAQGLTNAAAVIPVPFSAIWSRVSDSLTKRQRRGSAEIGRTILDNEEKDESEDSLKYIARNALL